MDGSIPSWQRQAQAQEEETRAAMEKAAVRDEYSQGYPDEDMVVLAAGVSPIEALLADGVLAALGRFWWVLLILAVVILALIFFAR